MKNSKEADCSGASRRNKDDNFGSKLQISRRVRKYIGVVNSTRFVVILDLCISFMEKMMLLVWQGSLKKDDVKTFISWYLIVSQ